MNHERLVVLFGSLILISGCISQLQEEKDLSTPPPPKDTMTRPHKEYMYTTSDLLREDPVSGVNVAIYLGGLSRNIRGNGERQRIDTLIRNLLRREGYEVVSIAVTELDDSELLKSRLKLHGS
jgi:hypothetical protein